MSAPKHTAGRSHQDFDNLVDHLVDTVRLGFPVDRPANDFDIEEAVRCVLIETGHAPASECDPTIAKASGADA